MSAISLQRNHQLTFLQLHYKQIMGLNSRYCLHNDHQCLWLEVPQYWPSIKCLFLRCDNYQIPHLFTSLEILLRTSQKITNVGAAATVNKKRWNILYTDFFIKQIPNYACVPFTMWNEQHMLLVRHNLINGGGGDGDWIIGNKKKHRP